MRKEPTAQSGLESGQLPTQTIYTSDSGSSLGELPKQIGKYRIQKIIAAGGMGIVYEATQENPQRLVAVKVMSRGVASKSAMRRFEFEGQVLGRLRHPGIAQIYEAGTHIESGVTVPYFAMEYIAGARTITQFARENKLSTRERMKLFAQVCDAVHHGHQKGVIHRDLKPSNILVDTSGQVKIIDFGVARGTDSDLALTTLQTDVGQLIGTLQYMSPEQCEVDAHDIDTRSDVYALGVVFFELLAEKLPYDLREKAIHEATRVIREDPPTRLSLINRTLRGDVETIALKALEKDRTRRYQSASDFGKDIERYLVNEPISARRPSMVYRLSKFVRRRRIPLATAAAILVALGIGVDRQIRASWTESLLRTRETAYSVFMAAQPDEALDKRGRVIADCTRAIEMDPSLALAYALRAKAYLLSGNDNAAWHDARRAVEIEPQNAYAHRALAHVYLMRNEFEKAGDAYEKGFQKFIEGTDLPRDLHNRARIYSILGDYASALKYHDGAVALAPKESRVQLGRALTRRMVGDIDGALRDIEGALKLEPGHWDWLGALWAWEMLMHRNGEGDKDKAVAALARAAAAARKPGEQEVVAICRGSSDGATALTKTTDNKIRCTIYYYLGVRALVDQQPGEARTFFERSLATGSLELPEADLSRWHLRRL